MKFVNSFLLLLTLIVFTYSWSPTDSYAPGKVQCPSFIYDTEYNTPDHHGFTRKATTLSKSEIDWLEERHKITDQNLKWFLNLADMRDLNTDQFIDSLDRSINIGLAFSGGGYRAMLTAAGEISGLDNRTNGIMEYGLPILPAVSYITGLSGGSWFLGTLAYNNWTSVQDIINTRGQKNAIWDLKNSIFTGHGANVFKDVSYWRSILKDLKLKKDAGFEISLTDPWSRTLSHQFFPNLTDFGASMSFSDIRDFPVFKNHEMPFPIFVADGRAPGTYIISDNSTIFEFNPFELGSWDYSLRSFVDLKYIGTDLTDGFPTKKGKDTCIAGFDNIGYVFGTSSTLFNQAILQIDKAGLDKLMKSIAVYILEDLSKDENDIADYQPNPFYKTPWAESSKSIVNSLDLHLVDGGEDSQNIPLYPLIQKERKMDVIFAYDNSMDTREKWPSGKSLMQTYRRQFSPLGLGTAIPYIPDDNTFLNLGLNKKPTFFGCYAKNLTGLMEQVHATEVPPLIIYIANSYQSYYSNTSTLQMKYDTDEMLGIFRNGFEVSTRKNLTLDDEWRACVGCAILQRSKEKQGIPMGDQCQKCFDEYCWDGSTDSTYNKVVSGYRDYGMRFGSRRLAITKEDAEAAEAAENRDGDSIDDGKNGHGNFNIASVFGISNKLQEIKDKFKEIVKKIIKSTIIVSLITGIIIVASFIYLKR
ncbi:hypothetical protein B5S28_g3042 [[Candida] boidinii]|nr:hypothetical protein B5S28_g3042 [[Candida] boidinii]